MRIGPYRHRVQIMHRTQGVDDYGAPLPDCWEVLATVWAAIEPLKRGREYFRGDQEQTEATYDIRMRYREDLDAKMHIWHGDVKYNIEAVLQDNRCRETTARCRLWSFEQDDQEAPDTTSTTDTITTTDTIDTTDTEEQP